MPEQGVEFSLSVRPRHILRAGIAVAVALSVLSWLTQVRDPTAPSDELVRNIVNVDSELSLSTWLSSLGLVAAAIMMVNVARQPTRWSTHWRALAALFVLLSADEAASLHEKLVEPLRDAFDTGGVFLFAWVIPGAIGVALLVLILRRFVFDLDRRVRPIFLLAAALYVGGALGFEMIGGIIADSRGSDGAAYITSVTVEELLEMSGIVVVCYGLARLQQLPNLDPPEPA